MKPIANPPQDYSKEYLAQVWRQLYDNDRDVLKTNQDNYLGAGRIILTSPGGKQYALTVSEAGLVYAVNVESGIEMGGLSTDSFGRLRVSNSVTLFDSQQEYGLDILRAWDITANGTLPSSLSTNGSVSSAGNSVGPRNTNDRMTPIVCSSTNGHYAIMQSRQYARYIPGKSHLVFVTGTFAAGANATASIVRRTSTSGSVVDTSVAQASWNIDRFDGSGPSGVTIDFTKTQILFISAQWLGVGRVIVGFDVDGVLYPAHEFLNANNLAVPYTQSFNLPVRMEIRNVGASDCRARSGYFDSTNGIFLETARTTAGGTINFVCCSIQTEGGGEQRGFPMSAGNGTTTIGVTTRRPVLSIRPKATFNSLTNRGHIELVDFIISASGNACYYELVLGGTLTGASFASVATDSIVERDVAATAISGGMTILSGYASAGAGISQDVRQGEADVRSPLVLSQIDALTATQTPLTLVCTSMSATSTIGAAINWQEQTI